MQPWSNMHNAASGQVNESRVTSEIRHQNQHEITWNRTAEMHQSHWWLALAHTNDAVMIPTSRPSYSRRSLYRTVS